RLEIVVLTRRDAGTHKLSWLSPPTPFQIGHSIDVVGLPLHAPGLDPALLFEPVHKHIDLAPHEPLQTLSRDAPLDLDDFRETLLLDEVIDVVLVLHRPRAFLRRIRERAHPIELRLLEELEQRPEIIVGFAGKAHETRRADREIRDGVA